MEIVKLLTDYAHTPLEHELSKYFTQELDSITCVEKIKNKKFMIQYIKPINDFIVHTTAMPCVNVKRIFY